MICINDDYDISIQKEDLSFTYPFFDHVGEDEIFFFNAAWHEPLYKEKGQVYLAPLILVRWP